MCQLVDHYVPSQTEIDQFEKDFLAGKDPFSDLTDDTHLNSVASILKMFFRRLPEPIFPNDTFDQMMLITSE
jgi:hypothetical protein